ncbi:MAG: GAF domain-containing protein [Oscillospiraceae bacterium]|nr:GAF domain-containing protein [Oscillospiraceae bacterium]
MTPKQIRQFLRMCLALAAERDREKLLSAILDTAMDLSHCDAGTLYLLEDDGLHFCRMVTRSIHIRQGGHAAPIIMPPVPLDPSYVCSWVVLHNESINVHDVHTDDRFNFSGSAKYDELTGYVTKTMLVVPLSNDRGDLIGAMQLINALDEDGSTIPFKESVELLVRAISAQAAISVTNMQYSEQITALLDSLVGALSAAIDERTPYNANHTRNMVRYAIAFINWLDAEDSPLRFNADKRRTFLLSVWLHDVGKLVVPLEIMDKGSRLDAGMERVKTRFRIMDLLDRVAECEGRISAEEAAERRKRRTDGMALIERANTAGFLSDEDLAAIHELAALTYTDETGETHPWLTDYEHECLSVRKGTLTPEERSIMESHASVTARILEHVSFPKIYAQVPKWAAAHHEYPNGKGYPNHLSGDEIPWEVRLLTILDVYDALTAEDRPYKKPMPAERALSILHSMVEEGSLDGDVLALFEKSKAWEATE